jgi:hypothetical protein
MSEATSFVVGNVQFQLEPLKLKQQMKGETIVCGALLPGIVAFGGGALTAAAIADVLKGFERLPELFDIFVAKAKVNWAEKGFVPLEPFAEDVFKRRGDLLLGFVAECVSIEYGCFLDERGKSVLSKAAEKFGSLLV